MIGERMGGGVNGSRALEPWIDIEHTQNFQPSTRAHGGVRCGVVWYERALALGVFVFRRRVRSLP
jgi:hypothetical protein